MWDSGSYTEQRNVFSTLRNVCMSNQALSEQYIHLIASALSLYNTAIHENRFVTGGAIEYFTYMLLQNAGVACSIDENIGGIQISNGKYILVNSLSTGINKVILHNRVEKNEMIWDTSRFFIVSGIGIIYGDPEKVVNKEYIVRKPGHLELHKQALVDLLNDPENVIELEIPSKPPLPNDPNLVRRASITIAKEIIDTEKLNHFQTKIYEIENN